jgi:hypothetical protein
VPAATLDATATVRTLAPDPGDEKFAGANAGVIPVGAPVTVSATAELNPPLTAAVTVTDPFPPWGTCTEAGAAVTLRAEVAGAVASFQWLARTKASAEPSPVA